MRRSPAVVIAIATALVGPAGAATDPGERAYAGACATCHRVPSRVPRPDLSMTSDHNVAKPSIRCSRSTMPRTTPSGPRSSPGWRRTMSGVEGRGAGTAPHSTRARAA